MEAYKGSGGTAPLIISHGERSSSPAGILHPVERTQVAAEQQAG